MVPKSVEGVGVKVLGKIWVANQMHFPVDFP